MSRKRKERQKAKGSYMTLEPTTLFVESFTRRGYRFVRSNEAQQKILERNEDVKDFVAHEG